MEPAVLVTLHVLCVSCDLPAKAIVQNFVQFMEFMDVAIVNNLARLFVQPKVTTFPFNEDDPRGPPRLEQACLAHASTAVTTNTIVSVH